MLTALTIKDYSVRKSRLKLFKRDKTNLEVVEYNGVRIVHIIYSKYNKNINWDKIRELAGNEKNNILCSADIAIPKNCGIKRYSTNSLKERISENTALEVIKRCSENFAGLKVGLYDPNANKKDLIPALIKYTDNITVVTNATDEYYHIYKQTIADTGAVLMLKQSVAAFKGCNIVIAPEKIKVQLPVDDTTIVFTSAKPAICQSGRVFTSYVVILNESYKEIKPHSLSDEYFAQALYDKGKQYRLGSLLPILCISEAINSTIDEISRFVLQQINNNY
ncbi:MAG: hypothetical protein UE295_11575 [Acutalibacteraceae bacterium]|nr:hypothetical protein [Acutalibacteraceae bacterium]